MAELQQAIAARRRLQELYAGLQATTTLDEVQVQSETRASVMELLTEARAVEEELRQLLQQSIARDQGGGST
jgi:uncharacterized protein YerC